MGTQPSLLEVSFRKIVEKELTEDFGSGGDITSDLLVQSDIEISARIVSRQEGILAGDKVVDCAFEVVDPRLSVEWLISDGQVLSEGAGVASIVGRASSILKAERTALNFLGHLSGVATATRRMVDAVADTKAKICCTRKTTPTLRALEKYAVRVGGGINHRFGLDSGILIKDNHIVISGGITEALSKIGRRGPNTAVEIEVDTLEQLREALDCGVGSILLDNMDNSTLSEAVKICNGRALLEASGNVTIDSVRAIAETGVDYISSGWITHSSPVVDFGLDLAF